MSKRWKGILARVIVSTLGLSVYFGVFWFLPFCTRSPHGQSPWLMVLTLHGIVICATCLALILLWAAMNWDCE